MMDEKQKPLFVESLAGETKRGFDDAAGLPSRLTRFSGAHRRSLDMADYIKSLPSDKKNNELISSLKACGSYLLFRDYFRVGKIRLAATHTCKKHIICPFCAMRRGAKMLKAYLDRLAVIRKDDPGLKAYLVTLTIKDGDDLLERFNHLQESMRRYNQWRRDGLNKGRKVEFNKALGAVGSYEFKKGKGSGLWHPHFHAVWLCHDKPNQDQLSREWHEITGDSFIVNVTAFHDQDDVVGGFLEVFKYALKFSDMPLDQNWHGFQMLQGKRLVTSFGLFRGVVVPETAADDLLEAEPYVELFYRYRVGVGYDFVKASGEMRKPAPVPRNPLFIPANFKSRGEIHYSKKKTSDAVLNSGWSMPRHHCEDQQQQLSALAPFQGGAVQATLNLGC